MYRLDPMYCQCTDCLVGDSVPLGDIDFDAPSADHMALLLKVAEGDAQNFAFDVEFTAYYPKDVEDLTAILRVYDAIEDESAYIFYINSEMGC